MTIIEKFGEMIEDYFALVRIYCRRLPENEDMVDLVLFRDWYERQPLEPEHKRRLCEADDIVSRCPSLREAMEHARRDLESRS